MWRPWRPRDWGIIAVVSALAAATRLPWAGLTLGEPDGARYALGLEQWLRAGPGAPFIYAKVLSPGYYALGAWWVRHSGAAPLRLLEGWSWVAAVLLAPLLYFVGRCLTSRGAAAVGTGLFLLAPGVWWLGLEPHPEGLSLLCLVAALGCFLALPKWAGGIGAALALTAGLLLKNDLVLFALVFPALRLVQPASPAERRRQALRALAIPAAAGLAFLGARSALLGMGWGRAQGETLAAVRAFLSLPHGVALLKQVLPLLTAPGLATLALTLAGLALGWRRRDAAGRAWRRRWGWPVAAWVAPSLVFWMSIRGNNARHMAPLLLLPLWAGLEAWGRTRAWHGRRLSSRLAAAALGLAVACNWVLPPASSNLTLFPSGNVPASVADLRARTRAMDAWLRGLRRRAAARRQPPPCIVGNPTLPYLEFAREAAAPAAAAIALNVSVKREAMRIGSTAFLEADTPAQAAASGPVCRAAGAGGARSLEYTAAGGHRRFFGAEWRWLPLVRRWYPAAAVRLPRKLRH